MLDVSTRYPGQVSTADLAGYPLGAAQNITVPGDGTGTPWEEDLVNDILGFQQSLLDEASIAASGNPDKVGACQQLDALRVLFPDMLNGGTYAPANILEINGAGVDIDLLAVGTAGIGVLNVSTAFAVSGDMGVGGDTELVGDLEVQGTCDFQHIDAVSGTFTSFIIVLGLAVTGSASVSADLTVVDDVLIGDDLDVGGTATIDTAIIETSFNVLGTSTFAGPISFSSAGRFRMRPVVGNDADESRTTIQGDFHYSPATFSVSRTWTFDLSAHQSGDWFIVRNTTATDLVLHNGTGNFDTLEGTGSSGDKTAAMYMHNGTGWKEVFAEYVP